MLFDDPEKLRDKARAIIEGATTFILISPAATPDDVNHVVVFGDNTEQIASYWPEGAQAVCDFIHGVN